MAAQHEIERAVIALVVQHNRPDILDQLDAVHFDSANNHALYLALRDLARQRRQPDEPSLTAHLERTGRLAAAGGKAGVTALYYHDTALLANLKSYVADLRGAHVRREIATILASAAKASEREGEDLAAVLEQAETAVRGAIQSLGEAELEHVTASEMVVSALELVERARERGDGLVGADTGLGELNQMIGGWEPGTFTVIMGSPGVGKTALWLQSAVHVASTQPVAMVQLEMTPAKMGMRVLSNHARVSFRNMRRGNDLTDRDLQRLSDTMGVVAGRSLMVAPGYLHEWSDIRAWYRRMHLDHGASSLWVDNIKIVGMKNMRDLDRFQAITRGMKLLARELNVPVIAIHHMHRLEEGARPTLTSGYGSSSIEQDADNVIALWRPNEDDAPDEVEILPLKTRDDFAKPTTVRWVGDQQRYEAFAPATVPPTMPRLYD